MHETIIANEIITQAEKQGKVLSIKVEVGDLAHLPAHELKECLKSLVDWKIQIINKKALVRCACGYKGEPKILSKGHDSTVFVCPECGDIPKILKGDKIILKEVEVDE